MPTASISVEPAASLLPSESDGWIGQPGLVGQRGDGSSWSPRFSIVSVEELPNTLCVTSEDTRAGLRVISSLTLQAHGVATVDVELQNSGNTEYILDRMAVTIPAAPEMHELQVPEGRWVHEFHEVRVPWRVGATEMSNRRGRTSHDKPPWIIAGQTGFTNQTGRVLAAHLGWSGNASIRAEVFTDGRRTIQLGELLLGNEGAIASGDSYHSPTIYLAWSGHGINGASQCFHSFLRERPNHPQPTKPRPIHMNTWEAVYFNHDLETLKALADRAAEVGAERYVLDDGWFHGRRDDTAGLGDWWVDETVWPNGLNPLIEHVSSLGLEFGIWVEPEMVSPNSDLYRNHPEWALGVTDYDPVLGRNQLVLDLTNTDAWNYILEHLDALLTNHDVGYVKWDQNRDLTQPGAGDVAAAHGQVQAVYRLLDVLRERHPGVEIESCSSGGGRTDFGILQRTDRVWTSDSNDALERQRIQRGFLRFIPPELMGAHIGPGRSHTSGRRHSLSFRSITAMFGHLGIEWNLLDTTNDEREMLKGVLALHKEHRTLLHTGTVWQLDCADPGLHAACVVAQDSGEALLSVAQLTIARYATPERIKIPGLDPDGSYDISLLTLADSPAASGHPTDSSNLGLATAQPAWTQNGIRAVSGLLLETFGLQVPALDPESAVLIHIKQC